MSPAGPVALLGRLREAAARWRALPLGERWRSLPSMALLCAALFVADFATYAAGLHYSVRSWACTGGMLGLLLFARVGEHIDWQRAAWTSLGSFAGFVLLGLPFGLSPGLLLRMAAVNVTIVAAAMVIYWATARRRSEWFPSSPLDAFAVLGLCVGGAVVSAVFGGSPEAILGGDQPLERYLPWTVHMLNDALLSVIAALSLYHPPSVQYTRLSPRTVALVAPVCLAATFLPYLYPGYSTEWMVLLAACVTGLLATPRTIGVAAIAIGAAPLSFSQSPWSRIPWNGELPQPLFVELMLTMGVTLSFSLVSFREQQARLDAELAGAGLREAAQGRLLRSVVGGMSDGVILLDQQLRLVSWNPAARALVGAQLPTSGDPRSWIETYGLRAPDGSPLDVRVVAEALTVPEGRSASVAVLRPGEDGRPDRMYEAVVRPFRRGGERHTLMVITDTTAEQQRSRELEAFAGTVAHDLKNPLAAMALWVETAQLDVQDDPEAGREAVEEAVAAAARMNRLIDDYLAYTVTREGGLQWTSVDLAEVIRDVIAVHVAGPVDFHVDADATVRADRALLGQLLANLVGNSVKYARPGTRAQVRIAAGPDSEPGWVRVTVQDDGIGLGGAEDLFVPFARTAKGASTGQGIGLGLALCHAIVDRHGGTITGRDGPRGGACFEFTMPLAEALAAGPLPADSAIAS